MIENTWIWVPVYLLALLLPFVRAHLSVLFMKSKMYVDPKLTVTMTFQERMEWAQKQGVTLQESTSGCLAVVGSLLVSLASTAALAWGVWIHHSPIWHAIALIVGRLAVSYFSMKYIAKVKQLK